jgi:hypothetical protein
VAAGLVARGTCPACLDAAAQSRLADRMLAQARRASGRLFPCAAGGAPLSNVADLGLGCLYLPFAGGARIPDGVTKRVAIVSAAGSTLTFAGSDAASTLECTKSSGPGKHCLTAGNASCTTDGDCLGLSGACAFDTNCFFVQPIPIANGPLSICLVDVVETEETGTIDVGSGAISITEHHASRAYVTGDAASPCPRCVAGVCTAGKNAGGPCGVVGGLGTSVDCLPDDASFIAAVQLHEQFSTGASEIADFGAGFCPAQTVPGAYGASDGVRVVAAGSPAGSLADGAPHAVALASTFCVPSTGSPVLDALVKLPGPGMVSAAGLVRLE